MPTAIQDMARAAQAAGVIDSTLGINDAVASMLKLQEQGKLISSEVLPFFGKQLSKTFGKGLNKALESNRVAMNRLILTMQMSADAFFKSGFAEGLTDFFNTTSEMLKDNQELWSALGKIVGSALKGVSAIVRILTPIFSALGTILKGATDLLGDFSGTLLMLASPAVIMGVKGLAGSLGLVGTALKGILATTLRLVAPVLLAVGALEELVNFYQGGPKKGFFLPGGEQSKALAGQSHSEAGFMGSMQKGLAFTARGGPVGALLRGIANFDPTFGGSRVNVPVVNIQANVPMDVVATEVTKQPSYQSATETMIRERTE